MKPKSLEKLTISLNSLTGVSKKQAEKLAYNIVNFEQDKGIEVAKDIENAISTIKRCKQCGFITDQEVCLICSDNSRQKILVIVENSLDVFKFEETQEIKPYYHVLNGLINVSTNVEVEDLNLSNLKSRAEEMKEIIIALSPNMEGFVTANYVKTFVKHKKITELAQGIPLGAAMDYVDKLTLKAALDNRKDVK